jgi:hypothetical protein
MSSLNDLYNAAKTLEQCKSRRTEGQEPNNDSNVCSPPTQESNPSLVTPQGVIWQHTHGGGNINLLDNNNSSNITSPGRDGNSRTTADSKASKSEDMHDKSPKTMRRSSWPKLPTQLKKAAAETPNHNFLKKAPEAVTPQIPKEDSSDKNNVDSSSDVDLNKTIKEMYDEEVEKAKKDAALNKRSTEVADKSNAADTPLIPMRTQKTENSCESILKPRVFYCYNMDLDDDSMVMAHLAIDAKAKQAAMAKKKPPLPDDFDSEQSSAMAVTSATTTTTTKKHMTATMKKHMMANNKVIDYQENNNTESSNKGAHNKESSIIGHEEKDANHKEIDNSKEERESTSTGVCQQTCYSCSPSPKEKGSNQYCQGTQPINTYCNQSSNKKMYRGSTHSKEATTQEATEKGWQKNCGQEE